MTITVNTLTDYHSDHHTDNYDWLSHWTLSLATAVVTKLSIMIDYYSKHYNWPLQWPQCWPLWLFHWALSLNTSVITTVTTMSDFIMNTTTDHYSKQNSDHYGWPHQWPAQWPIFLPYSHVSSDVPCFFWPSAFSLSSGGYDTEFSLLIWRVMTLNRWGRLLLTLVNHPPSCL